MQENILICGQSGTSEEKSQKKNKKILGWMFLYIRKSCSKNIPRGAMSPWADFPEEGCVSPAITALCSFLSTVCYKRDILVLMYVTVVDSYHGLAEMQSC